MTKKNFPPVMLMSAEEAAQRFKEAHDAVSDLLLKSVEGGRPARFVASVMLDRGVDSLAREIGVERTVELLLGQVQLLVKNGRTLEAMAERDQATIH